MASITFKGNPVQTIGLQPVANVLPFAVNWQLFVSQGTLNHQWDQLFWELVRAVVV